MEEKLTWKEKFSATIVLFIGIIFLVTQILSILPSYVKDYSVEQGVVVINKNALFLDIRTYITIMLGITGAVLLFKKNKLGWIIGVPLISFFTILASWGIIQLAWMKIFDKSFVIVSLGWLLLFLSLIFLMIPSARRKYKVGKQTYLPTLVFLMALTALYFFLQ